MQLTILSAVEKKSRCRFASFVRTSRRIHVTMARPSYQGIPVVFCLAFPNFLRETARQFVNYNSAFTNVFS
ncbi:hypothetical protein PUN28_004866 [Cardiocondyla obscurior]|uniref:Uncharacterized protein n=1 Tax=Cardiocondyla obscurior TaxID=286306 RepID=A0AAW2GCW4_9HYME